MITNQCDAFDLIIGRSAAAEDMRAFASRAAAVDAPVLLTGESGTGKGILARAIHALSRRARAPFVTVNCAGVPDSLFESEFFGHARGAFTGATQPHRGLFEQAQGGTLFLDEVGELSVTTQAKLLTVFDEGRIRRVGAERFIDVEARLIAATNRDLLREVAQRTFRDDLYHRLLVLAWELPPLRERENDVELLMARFLSRHAQRHKCAVTGFSPRAHAHLRTHPWPGNVRQLDHAVEAAVLACEGPRIELRHLPRSLLQTDAAAVANEPPNGRLSRPTGRYSFHGSPAEERRHIEEALCRCHGNKTRAARELGMTRNTLRSRLAALCEPDSSHSTMVGQAMRVQDKSEIEQKRAVGTAHNAASNGGATE